MYDKSTSSPYFEEGVEAYFNGLNFDDNPYKYNNIIEVIRQYGKQNITNLYIKRFIDWNNGYISRKHFQED